MLTPGPMVGNMTALMEAPGGFERPGWARGDALCEEYYDTEWGVPVVNERGLYELVALEGFVVGLSWRLVLRRREGLRRAFEGFEPDVVAAYGEEDVRRILAADDVIRNERKIRAAITNAQATVGLRSDGGLAELVWSAQPAQTPVPRAAEDVPSVSPESERLAGALRHRGFVHVGPVTIQALMAAAGVIDLHLAGSPRRGCSGLWHRTGRRRARPRLPGA